MKPAVKVIQAAIKTGAVDKYFVKLSIFYPLLYLINEVIQLHLLFSQQNHRLYILSTLKQAT